MGTINRPFNDYSRSSIRLLGLLHGKYHHRSDAYICTMLEISNADYQKLCTNAKQKNLLAENGQLTSEGRKTYTSIRKVEFETKPLVEKQIDKIDYLYLPNRFLGFSKFQCY